MSVSNSTYVIKISVILILQKYFVEIKWEIVGRCGEEKMKDSCFHFELEPLARDPLSFS